MSEYALQVHGLSKKYRIGTHRTSDYTTLRDVIADRFSRAFRRSKAERVQEAEDSTIWALRDVSFNVKHGEVVGIIGRNGAGKSTLLKILSRITDPTEGTAHVFGRVGALLEVGTGFHAELTGRENIYLNGAILGMSRADIAKRFDEIVAFAEVEKFIDTPVKNYSSGMGLRLGFAVAAHLEPEILIVDEVLAVGDVQFQKKCLGKMGQVAGEGRTVLFVSHQLQSMAVLCTRGLILEAGGIKFTGQISSAITNYTRQSQVAPELASDLAHLSRRVPPQNVIIERVEIRPANGELRFPYKGEDIDIQVRVRCLESTQNMNLAAVIWSENGARLIDATTSMKSQYVAMQAGDISVYTFHLQQVLLRPSNYVIEVWAGIDNGKSFDYIPEALLFEIALNPNDLDGQVDFPGSYRCNFVISNKMLPNVN